MMAQASNSKYILGQAGMSRFSMNGPPAGHHDRHVQEETMGPYPQTGVAWGYLTLDYDSLTPESSLFFPVAPYLFLQTDIRLGLISPCLLVECMRHTEMRPPAGQLHS